MCLKVKVLFFDCFATSSGQAEKLHHYVRQIIASIPMKESNNNTIWYLCFLSSAPQQQQEAAVNLNDYFCLVQGMTWDFLWTLNIPEPVVVFG
jgi:hypothetical protein